METICVNILAVITARGGSKGIPHKNIYPLCGKPLIGYSIEAAKNARLIDRCIVSTDDKEIADVARSFGADVPFFRPPELATDEALQQDVLLHALENIERTEQIRYSIVVLLQPSSPLRIGADIDGALNKMISSGADSVVSFHRVESGHPFYMYSITEEHPKPLLDMAPSVARRQEFPTIYLRNGAIYALRREVVQQRILYGQNMQAYVMPLTRSVNIDSKFDLEIAELLLKRYSRSKERRKN